MKQFILTETNLPNGILLDEHGYAYKEPTRDTSNSVVLNSIKMHCQQYANKMIEYFAQQLADSNQVVEVFVDGLYDSLDFDVVPSDDDIFYQSTLNASENFYFCPELSRTMGSTIASRIINGFGLDSLANLVYGRQTSEGHYTRIPFTIDNSYVTLDYDGQSFWCICIKRYDGQPYEISDVLIAYDPNNAEVYMNKYVHRSDVTYTTAAITRTDWVAVTDLIKSQLENNTMLDMFQYTASLATQALAKGADSVDLSMLQGYMENQCGGQLASTASEALTEIQSAVSQDSSPSGVLQYIIQKMRESCGSTSGSSSILTDNSSLVTKSLSAGIIKGIAIAASAIATIVGTAIGGVFGAAIAVVSSVASALLTTTQKISDELTYARYASNVVANDLFPIGLLQYSSSDASLDWHPGVDQTGVGSSACPCFEIFSHLLNTITNIVEQEVHLSAAKLGWSHLSDVISYNSTTGLVSWSLSTTPSDVVAAMLTESNANVMKYSGSQSATDDAFRLSYITSLAYLLVSVLCAGNGGATRLNVSMNSSNTFEASIATFLAGCLTYSSSSAAWNEVTWSALTGSSGSGSIGNAIKVIAQTMMSSDWYQSKNINFNDKSFVDKYVALCLYMNTASASNNVTGFVAAYAMPYTSILLPVFERTTFWMDVAMTVAGIVLTAVTIIAVTVLVKNRVRRYNTLQTAKVESAWTALTENPTKETAQTYNKLVKKHNLVARFTGGTLYSRSNYWGDASSANDTIRANLIDYTGDFTSLTNLINLLSGSVTSGFQNTAQAISQSTSSTAGNITSAAAGIKTAVSAVNENVTGHPLDNTRQPQFK